MRKIFATCLFLILLFLTACASIMENIPRTYTIDIQQGNVFSQEVIDQLRPNMNQRRILYIMGSPMLRNVFNKKRWDYIFFEQLGGKKPVQKRVELYFADDKLVSIKGDLRPSNVLTSRLSHKVTIDLPKLEKEKTLAEKFSSLFDF